MSKKVDNTTKEECLKILNDGIKATQKAGFKILNVKIK